MADLDTRPVPVPTPLRGHEHAWLTDSRHPTSEGVLVYVRCAGCGVHRVDLQDRTQSPPHALSRELGEKRED
ncbi:hypothetical protein [Microbacterium sp.]|uniref:hypothetical protein n=1 Tax=Microbacterium sp. TaxID=51671 RepID=UPI002810B1EC|nr:hypothetical protein [Microbacterium sp.]